MSRFSPACFVSCMILMMGSFSLSAQDVAVHSILQPTATVCGGDLFPTVVIGNEGTIDLTSLRVNYELDGTVIANFNWIGTLTPGQTDTINFPFLSLPLGIYTLRVFSSDPNFTMDINPLNDTLQRTFEVTESIGTPIPFRADFDATGFPYDGYILNNPDGGISWERTETAAYTGTGSLYMNNYNYNGIGQEDEFTLPGVNMTTTDKAGLQFLLSYAQYGVNSGFADTLEVYVSGDCGVTFDRVYQKYGADLATAPATTAEFFPRGTFDWRLEWVDLSNYFEATFLVIRFRHVSNYENNLFLDRIRVSKIFSLSTEDDLTFADLSASQDANDRVTIRLNQPYPGTAALQVTDLQGRVIYQEDQVILSAQELSSFDASSMSAGLYHIQLKGDVSTTVPLMIR